jgi:hypothetical protein
MWGSLLEQQPQIVADHLRLSTQAPVPDSFHDNPALRQERVALGIMLLLRGVTVLEAVGF